MNKVESRKSGDHSQKPGVFKKGHDPRRNSRGAVNKNRVQFNRTLRELIVSEGEEEWKGVDGNEELKLKKVEWLVKSVWKKAIEGEAWAVNFIADRVEGKITQPLDVSGQIEAVVVSDKFLPKDEDGTKPE